MGDSLTAHLYYGFIVPERNKKYKKTLLENISKSKRERILLDANQYEEEDFSFKDIPLKNLVSGVIKHSDVYEVRYAGNLWHGSSGVVVGLKNFEIEADYKPLMLSMEKLKDIPPEQHQALMEFRDKYFPKEEIGWTLFPSTG